MNVIKLYFVIRGTKTSVNIDNVEERKIHDHFNFVTTKLEKLHKNLMWNMFIGRSYLDKVSLTIKCAKLDFATLKYAN